ncbi:MAG: hypothetical protein PHH73_02035 [Candidatus Rickettsiella isopodorum]|nr:hypothetical protein [Candidatus Rickettsiella isopodorum]
MNIAKIKLDEIRIDGGTQQRCEINNEVVTEYYIAINDGIEFPAVTLFLDGIEYWLADGFHRFLAHQRLKSVDILAEIRKGNRRDALLYSTGANNTHGLRVTNADKRKSVLVLLADAEWSQWSNRQIAKHCNVSKDLVAELRNLKVAEKPLSEKKSTTARPVEHESNEKKTYSAAKSNEKKESSAANIDDINNSDIENKLTVDLEKDDDIKSLKFEITELMNEKAIHEKRVSSLIEKQKQLESIINSDDKLQSALDEYNKLYDLYMNQAVILNSLQIDLNEHKRSHAYWKKEAGKLKFQLDKIKRESV